MSDLVTADGLPIKFHSVNRAKVLEMETAWDKLLTERADTVAPLTQRFATWIDPTILRDPHTVFTGSGHPYSYTWVNMGKQHTQYRTELAFDGYKPVAASQLEDCTVAGSDACLLGIVRTERIMDFWRQNKKTPPPVPEYLLDKVGFIVPPLVDSSSNRFFFSTPESRKELFRIEKELLRELQRIQARKSNQKIQPVREENSDIEYDIKSGRANSEFNVSDFLRLK